MSSRAGCLRRCLLAAALAALLFRVAPAAAEDAVLLASTVPGYAPGMAVSSANRLIIPEGASVTLLFQSGEILRLGGPFEGMLQDQQGKPGGAEMLAGMFRLQGVDATVVGGTRAIGPGRSGGAIDDVLVDPQRSGTYCVTPSTAVWIARPPDRARYSIRRKASNRVLAWPEDATRAEWPADISIDDGSQFEIATDGAARSTVTFHVLEESRSAGFADVANRILLGCHEQYDGTLRRLSRASVRPELFLTTDRGRHPVYRQGEAVALTVVANMDGYLFCVADSRSGSAAPIFPGEAVDGSQIRASAVLVIPGRRQPVGVTAAPDLQAIRCWLADRDITPELPHALLGPPSGAISEKLAGGLDDLFAHIGGTQIETDVVRVKVQ